MFGQGKKGSVFTDNQNGKDGANDAGSNQTQGRRKGQGGKVAIWKKNCRPGKQQRTGEKQKKKGKQLRKVWGGKRRRAGGVCKPKKKNIKTKRQKKKGRKERPRKNVTPRELSMACGTRSRQTKAMEKQGKKKEQRPKKIVRKKINKKKKRETDKRSPKAGQRNHTINATKGNTKIQSNSWRQSQNKKN